MSKKLTLREQDIEANRILNALREGKTVNGASDVADFIIQSAYNKELAETSDFGHVVVNNVYVGDEWAYCEYYVSHRPNPYLTHHVNLAKELGIELYNLDGLS